MIRSLKDQGPSISEISRRLLQNHHDLHRRMNKNGVKSIGRLMTIARFMPKSMQKRIFGGF